MEYLDEVQVPLCKKHKQIKYLVRVTGSAPMTFCSQNRRATRLRYTRKLQFTNSAKLSLFGQLAWRDSNTQQPSYQDGILPVELQASHLSFTLGSVTDPDPPVKQNIDLFWQGNRHTININTNF